VLLDKYVSKIDYESYDDFKKNCKIIVPENFNFGYDVIDEYAKISPNKRAMVWCNDRGDSRTFTFGEMSEYSNRIANFLLGIGLTKGDRVMMILKRRWEFWMCMIAMHKIGVVAIPATHLLTSKDIVYRVNSADIKMIIACDDERVMDAVDEAQQNSPTLKHKAVIHTSRVGWHSFSDEVENASADFIRPSGKADTANGDMMLLYFTSGTTGMPKMVWHDFTYPLGHILTAKFWQNVIDDGLHLTLSDTGWAKCAWGKIYGQWISGTANFIYDFDGKFEPADLLRKMQDYKITTFCGPATVYRFIAQQNLADYDLSSLKYCVTAGEPLYPEVYQGLVKAMGLKIMEGFGQTESVVMVANFLWMTPKPGSMGKPSPCYDVDIIDENGRSCEVGEDGEIVVRTSKSKPPGMFNGYFRDDDLTNRVWHDGIYHTGDVAWRDEDGYYWYVGRNDDMIKSSGYRIGPFEVESTLMEHAAVMECAITGVPDDLRGQVIKATVVLSPGYEASDELVTELQNYVKQATAPYKYPRIIEFVDILPRTISGKVRRVEIRAKDKKTGYKPDIKAD
jgi:acetyl-CoA synthetase